MTHLKDWAKAEDVKYAVDKYEGRDGPTVMRRQRKLVEMEKLLIHLDSMLIGRYKSKGFVHMG